MNFLETIVGRKKQSVAEAKEKLPLSEMAKRVSNLRPRNDFRQRLLRGAGDTVRVIAEIKRASPSKGTIAAEIEPAAIARDYASGGASAISVLTEASYFHAFPGDFRAVREAVPDTPLLRKDFVVDEYQIYESVLMGADALLLIVAALDKATLADFVAKANECGISALVEVHAEEELDAALAAGAQIIGVNNRNLVTFEVSQDASVRVARRIPEGIVSVSESGISGVDGVRAAGELGYHAVLIGEHFMRAESRVEEVRKFAHQENGKR